jgi:endonuclease YncB( thermonuclease family)
MSMRDDDLRNAVEEAKRFIERAEAVELTVKKDKWGRYDYGKCTAAAKRASMDLTRALVRVRSTK